MKRNQFILRNTSNFLVTLFFTVALMASDQFRVYDEGQGCLQAGEAANVIKASRHGTIRSESKIQLSGTEIVPKLVGNRALEALDTPLITYFIRVLHLSKSRMDLEIGIRIITQSIRFEAKGYDAGELHKRGVAMQELKEGDRDIYFVKAAFYGGSETRYMSFKRAEDQDPLDQVSLEFERSDEGVTQFKQKLFDMLWSCQAMSKSGYGSAQFPPVIASYAHVVGETVKTILETDFEHAKKGEKKPKNKKIPKKAKTKNADPQEISLMQSIEDMTKRLNDYARVFLESSPNPNLQGYLLMPYPILGEDVHLKPYDKIDSELCSEYFPKLETLADKYTVEVYQFSG